MDKHDRITQALAFAQGEVSFTRSEFARQIDRERSGLLNALVSLGYVRRGQTTDTFDRFAVTAAGSRRLAAAKVDTADE